MASMILLTMISVRISSIAINSICMAVSLGALHVIRSPSSDVISMRTCGDVIGEGLDSGAPVFGVSGEGCDGDLLAEDSPSMFLQHAESGVVGSIGSIGSSTDCVMQADHAVFGHAWFPREVVLVGFLVISVDKQQIDGNLVLLESGSAFLRGCGEEGDVRIETLSQHEVHVPDACA